MGQQQSKGQQKKNHSQGKLKFQRDPRLVEAVIFIPQLFQGVYNKQIKLVQKLNANIPDQPLYRDMIDGINQRFQLKNEEAKNKEIVNFYELQKYERFNQLLFKIEKWYHIEKQLNKISNGESNKTNQKITIRKKITPNYTCSINIDLLAKLFLHFYLVVLKKNFASKSVDRKKISLEFHDGIGKMLCKMVQYKNLSQNKLNQLLYKIVYIEKIDSLENLKSTLSSITQQFWPIYLTKQHSIGIQQRQYKRFKQIARCYLSQLYLRSIKEAEDPQINNQNQELGQIRSFPITRVKQNTKMK